MQSFEICVTMQCRSRSHSRRRISECLFVTACSMDEYAEENRKEFNCTSGISEAETTNNKRLSSTFCIEAIQTRSIARPLCDSRASCSQWTWEQKSQIWWHATHQSYSRLRYDCLVYSQKLTGSHVRSPLYVIIYRTKKLKYSLFLDHRIYSVHTLNLYIHESPSHTDWEVILLRYVRTF